MKEIIVDQKSDGRRVDRFLTSAIPGAGMSQAQKYLRLKKVRLNGRHPKPEDAVRAGDTVQIFLNDDAFAPPERKIANFTPHISPAYEDEFILVVDKKPGLRVHADETEKIDTLMNHARAYLARKGQGEPVLCNRIDRFTGGLVIIAKDAETAKIIDAKLREREIGKFYLCAALGHLGDGQLENYIVPEGQNRVRVVTRPAPKAKLAVTNYKTLCEHAGLSLAECELTTGRTHQIRAQLARAGHPIIGDTQYGDRRANEKYAIGYQALCAYRLEFAFKTDAGKLACLAGKSVTARKPGFVGRLFPGCEIPE